MLIVSNTPNGYTVQAVGTDGKLYSFWGRRPMPQSRADAIVREHENHETIVFAKCREDIEDALADWAGGVR